MASNAPLLRTSQSSSNGASSARSSASNMRLLHGRPADFCSEATLGGMLCFPATSRKQRCRDAEGECKGVAYLLVAARLRGCSSRRSCPSHGRNHVGTLAALAAKAACRMQRCLIKPCRQGTYKQGQAGCTDSSDPCHAALVTTASSKAAGRKICHNHFPRTLCIAERPLQLA